ncbi:LEA type 2 family protein [Fibrella sp. HMF5335]|uniref:LEA type 2 family protein n=1 Tax=Fibrella rubiginis TaxID=2817060 RepID=A0A939GDG8_9BACT|nr:LEA type 2 family protein [Fibrella rubiginis]MBO0935219.1 LEA type 2 family protein [Fibrella rubiginis]
MKRGWIIALALLLLGGLGAFIWYNQLKNKALSEGGAYDGTLKPRLELSRFDLSDVSDEAVKLNMYLLIDNPLPVSFTAKKVDYTIFINNEEVMKSAYEKTISVKSQDSTLVTLPARLEVKKLTSLLKRLEAKGIDSADYRVVSIFALDVPIAGERTFTNTLSKRMPAYHIPEFKIIDIDLGKLGLKTTDVAAKIECRNKNKFPFEIRDTHYSVTIDGKPIAEGDQPQPIRIRAQANTPFVLPTTVKPGQSLGLLPKMLFNKKDTKVEVAFRCKMIDRSKNPMFDGSKFVSTIRGTLADFVKK